MRVKSAGDRRQTFGVRSKRKQGRGEVEMRVGVIGLGRMGAPMARNLLAAGHEVTVYNRSRGAIEELVAVGATAARDVAGACTGDLVVTMLPDDAAIEEVVLGSGGVIASSAPDSLHISASTIGLPLVERLTEAHAGAGQGFVAAPVFGRPEAAAARKLFVVAAGAGAAIERAAPVLEAIGQRTFVVSGDPRAAAVVKLSGNLLIASVIESLGEAMALVSKAGVDEREYLEILTSTLFDAPVYRTYGGLIADRRFTPAGFAAPTGLKDVRLVLEAGDELRVPLPLASLLRDRLLRLLAEGGDELDWTAIGALAARDSGQS